MLFSSSGGAQNFQGQVGSTLYIDEISLSNTSGVYELFSDEIAVDVYPNPTSDFLNVNIIDEVDDLNYNIYNSNGKLVAKDRLKRQTIIDITSLNKGKYFLSVFDDKGLVASKNFIVVK